MSHHSHDRAAYPHAGGETDLHRPIQTDRRSKMKRFLLLFMILGLVPGSMTTAEAHSAETVSSGTIVTGAWWDAYLHGETGCQTAPECRAWASSGCQPALTGRALTERDPGLMASIVDVADLAERVTSWGFQWENGYSDNAGWVVVQLWRENCTEITTRKWCSVSGCNPYSATTPESRDTGSTVFRIPSSARFMTVTGWPYLPWPGEFVGEPVQRPIIDWTLSGPLR
jgi:hypothetical protein